LSITAEVGQEGLLMHSSSPPRPLLKARAQYSNSVENGLFSVLMVKNVSSIGMFVLPQERGEYIFSLKHKQERLSLVI
jgi:hypothetical protein